METAKGEDRAKQVHEYSPDEIHRSRRQSEIDIGRWGYRLYPATAAVTAVAWTERKRRIKCGERINSPRD